MRAVDSLEPFRTILADGGYRVDDIELPEIGPAILAETPYALVLCIITSWQDALGHVENAQAALTRLSAEHPSPRSWDLYVVVVVDEDADDSVRVQLECDTRYARKLVAVGVAGRPALAERALLSLRPLRGAAQPEPIEPLAALRRELDSLGVDEALAGAALSSFASSGQVTLP